MEGSHSSRMCRKRLLHEEIPQESLGVYDSVKPEVAHLCERHKETSQGNISCILILCEVEELTFMSWGIIHRAGHLKNYSEGIQWIAMEPVITELKR